MFTVLGWTWLGLTHLSYDEETEDATEPVEGFEIWKYVADRLKVGEREFKSGAYNSFKDALRELETLEAIKRCGPAGERKLARITWLPTESGQKWWQEKGLDLHGEDRPRDARTGIAKMPPMGKWLDLSPVNGATRRLIITKIFSGQVQVALRQPE